MAMSNCRDCGAEVSTSAYACPKCGAVQTRVKVAAGIVALAIVALAAIPAWNTVAQWRVAGAIQNALADKAEALDKATQTWSYDAPGIGLTRVATLSSTTRLSFAVAGEPKPVEQRVTLVLSRNQRENTAATLTIARGEFACAAESCPLGVRFDGGDPFTFSTTSLTSRGPNVLVVKDYERFYAEVAKSSRVELDGPFNGDAAARVVFQTAGFNASKYVGVAN